jgi:glutamine phosphoribosylpyrophosphate amidotransferase
MCGVIGVSIVNPTNADLQTIRNLFIESRIRGKHATGVTFYKDGKLNTIKEPIPADEFIEKYDPSDWVCDNKINLIGHCRYSTSDLQFNQPIADSELSLVHNGVISQELPENWSKLYGFETQTRNDSELLFHTLKEGNAPSYWEDASISAIWLTKQGQIEYYRNGKRPLWVFEDDRSLILTSTKDIAKRAGIVHGTRRVEYSGRDLQPAL